MSDKVRVLRILEYVGDRDWVESTLAEAHVPMNGMFKNKKGCMIKSAIVDQFPEILDKEQD